jgi:transcriptional regulator with XRE-family HTH domain
MADDAGVGRPIKPLERNCDTPVEALGAVITDLRVERGWSSLYVAERVGCNDSYMLRIEHGTENPTFAVLKAIADTHKIKLSLIIARAERKHENCKKSRRG